MERKDTNPENPKEAAGRGRIPLHLIPDGALAWVAMALMGKLAEVQKHLSDMAQPEART